MKKTLLIFFMGIILGLGISYSSGSNAETRLYVSEDLLKRILSTLEEIKANQADMQRRAALQEIKQLSIKIDQVLYVQQEILQELHKIKLRI